MGILSNLQANSGEPLAVSQEFFNHMLHLSAMNFTPIDQDAFYEAICVRMEAMKMELTKTRGLFTLGSIGVIPINGVISQKYHWIMEYFGGASTEAISNAIATAMESDGISSVLLDVNSPGGSVNGVTEAAKLIRSMREIKPIHAIANPLSASAAYCIASSATRVHASPSAMVGSVGTIATHFSYAKQLEDEGVEVTMVMAGDRKADGNPYEPLSPEAKADMQAKVDEYNDMFIEDVSQGMGVSPSVVRENFGKGALLTASEAKKVGMIHGVSTAGELINALTPKKKAGNRANRMRVASL